MFFSLLKKQEVMSLIEKLEFYYDCNLNFLKKYTFYLSKANKVYIANFDVSKLDLKRINSIGLYFGTFHDERFRLSIEGTKFVDAKQNFIELNEKSFKSFICAENLFKNEVDNVFWNNNCPFLIVKFKGENLGCVSIKNNQILNYTPKSRKLDFNKVF